jgi:hypothetical protein
MMNASGENGESSDSEDSSDDDVQDDASVESDKYSADKFVMCEVCKGMVRKYIYPVCHEYRYTSGDDSKGGAKGHDPNAKQLEYCDMCKRSVTCEKISICRVIRTVSSAGLTYPTMTALSSGPEAHDPAQLSLSWV